MAHREARPVVDPTSIGLECGTLREIHIRDWPDDPIQAVEVALAMLHWAQTHPMTFSRKRLMMLEHASKFARQAVEGM